MVVKYGISATGSTVIVTVPTLLISCDPLKVSVAVKLNAPASPLKFAFGVKVTTPPFTVNVPSFVLSAVMLYVITPAGILLSVVKLGYRP